MPQFEVAQASLRRWNPIEKVEDSKGLFLEIYPETRDTEKRLRCRMRCRCSKHSASQEQPHSRTDVVPESRDMRWRRYNSDGFLIALFTIAGPTVSRARRGDGVTMVCEIFRQPLETSVTTTPVFLGTFHAKWAFCIWGTLRLRPSQDSIEEGLQEDLELMLDLRPRQSRPFSLQNAKPYLERATIQELSARTKGARVSMSFSDGSEHTEGNFGNLPRNASRKIKAVYRGLLNLKNNRLDEDGSGSDGRERPMGVTFSVNEESGWSGSFPVSEYRPRTASLEELESPVQIPPTPLSWGSASSRPPNRDSVTWQPAPSEASHRSLFFDNTTSTIPSTLGFPSQSHTSSSGLSSWVLGDNAKARVTTMSRKSNKRNSVDSGSMHPSSRSTRRSSLTFTARSSWLTSSARSSALHIDARSRASLQSRDPFQRIAEKALRMRVPNFFSKQKSERQLVHWVPQETTWHQLWKKQWPTESDELTEGIEVTPIMEAEFRKDCLVFFNSMFPRVDSERFVLFRDLAFQRHSKLRFPVLKRFDRGTSFGPKSSMLSAHSSSRHWMLMRRDSVSTSRGSGDEEDSEADSDDELEFDTLSSVPKSDPDFDYENSSHGTSRRRFGRRRFRWCGCCRKLGRKRSPFPHGSGHISRNREGSSSTGSQVSQVYSSSSKRSIHSPRRSSVSPPGSRVRKMMSGGSESQTPPAETPQERMSRRSSHDSAVNHTWIDQFRVLNEPVPSERDRIARPDDPNRPSLSKAPDSLSKLQAKANQSSNSDDGEEGEVCTEPFRLRIGKRIHAKETVFGVCCSTVTALDEIEVNFASQVATLSLRQTCDQIERPMGDITPLSAEFQNLERDSTDSSPRRANGVVFKGTSQDFFSSIDASRTQTLSPEISRATCKSNSSQVSGEQVIDLDASQMLPPVTQYDSMASSFSGTLINLPSTQRSEISSMRSLRSDIDDWRTSRDATCYQRRNSIASTVTDQPSMKRAAVISTFSLGGCVYADEYSPRIMIMKRLFLSFAICGVYYTEVANSPQLGELWPYPMGTILGHGSRVLIRLEDVEGSAFLNFLLFGDPSCLNWRETGIPPPLKSRMAATHSVQIETETGHLIERKLKLNTMDTLQNIADGIRKRHLGINLPIGGVANPSAVGGDQYIDFTGRVVRKVDPNLSTKSASVVRFISGYGSASINCDETVVEEDDGRSETKWMPLPKVQGGHLYLRVDEFGENLSCWRDVFSDGSKEAAIKDLRRKLDRDAVILDLYKRKAQIQSQRYAAGELFFSNQIATLKVKHRNALPYVADNDTLDDSRGKGLCLLRVSSDPCLHYCTLDALPEDIKWMNRMIKCKKHVPLTIPPSAAALEMLLHHYHPMNAQFFGTARHNSFQEFFRELVDQKSFLIKGDSRLERVVEPLILRLQWRNRVLMLTHEVKQEQDHPVQKRTFVCARMSLGETWMQAARRALNKELDLRLEDVIQTLTTQSLDPRVCHQIIEESAVSPTYPGIRTFYRTHHVEWSIRDDCINFFGGHGLPPNLAKRETTPCNSDFSTVKDTQLGVKILYWRWVDIHVARTLQSFLNMGEANPDERWAKYAFQQNGIIHPPPSDNALGILLKRCGIDITRYGDNGCKSLSQLRVEIMNQECHLLMNKSQLLRVAEDVLVRLRCRKKDIGVHDGGPSSWVLLVRLMTETEKANATSGADKSNTASGTDKDKETKKYSFIRGRKDKEEAWQDAAIACVSRDLDCTKAQVKGFLEPGLKPGDASVSFYEERGESPSYPQLETLYKTHLVTLTIRHDILAFSSHQLLFGGNHDVDFSFRDSTETPVTPSSPSSPTRRGYTTCFHKPIWDISQMVISVNGKDFSWMIEEEASKVVADAKLWQEVLERQERRQIHSVLLGLEGTAPQCKSPFGTVHNIKGAASKVSANGNRKWKAYRTNNALQIPASEGGLRVKIDRKLFEELVETCEMLDLLDPKLELSYQRGQAWRRELLDQRYAEKELFKQVLAGNGEEAKQAVTWMKTYRANHKSSARVFKDLLGRRLTKENASPRSTRAPETSRFLSPDVVRKVTSRT